MQGNSEEWDCIIRPQNKWHDLHLKEIWKHKDLLFLFVKRDLSSAYKQTILGPLWFFIQPLITTITFTIIFGKLAQLSTDGMPSFIFYLSGITTWTYFAECLTKTSNTFVINQQIFGKVYFPRLIMPLSIVITNMAKLGIQLLLFLSFWIYFYITTDKLHPNTCILLLPVLIIIMAGLGLGFGMIISSLTTKYRDLTFLVGFGVQLLMYASPIIMPMSSIHGKLYLLFKLNPMTSIINTFKYAFLGVGEFDILGLIYSAGFALFVIFIGIAVFNRVEKTFIDTV